MKFIADLHIHSRYSRATARNLNPENLALWAARKGIFVVGTGDFTHPAWTAELGEKLVEAEPGLFALRPDLQRDVDEQLPRSCRTRTRFLLSGEISCIYKKDEKTRKVHHLILLPDMAAVERFQERLGRIGNITSDGRPILGLDSRDLLEITLETSERAFFIPAHVWTPWFSLFGSKSGFDRIEDCFGDLTDHIRALETGLSSDPPMNRLLEALDRYTLVSNSDAHSPAKLGREANLFDTELHYERMTEAMSGGPGFLGTIEFFPEEGKYHLDGHRKCGVRLEPAETRARKGTCPVCGKALTVGVLHRVEELADRRAPKLSKPFYSLIPLTEVLAELMECGPGTKKVQALYQKLLQDLGPELRVLLEVPPEDLERAGGSLLAEALSRMRQDRVIREGGYDGEYGTIRIFEEKEKEALLGQLGLFGWAPSSKKKKRLPGKAQRPPLEKPLPPGGGTGGPEFPDDPILGPLNPEQREAVMSHPGHLLIVAGPGTGKTFTLAHRVAWLIREGKAKASEVLGLTFTRKAAREMASRIGALLPGHKGENALISTFHGFCLEVLRKAGPLTGLPSPFALCAEWDSRHLARLAWEESRGSAKGFGRFWDLLPRLKEETFHEQAPSGAFRDMDHAFDLYQKRLREMGLVDLSDLEVETLRFFRTRPDEAARWGRNYPWVFVDEYQDTNPRQTGILKALAEKGRAWVCAIGDPDQAIYGFRGADVGNFHRFEEDFPGARRVVLTRNYRSSQAICDAAAAVVGAKTPLRALDETSSPLLLSPCRTEAEEAEMIVEQVERWIGGTTYFSLDSGRVQSHEGSRDLGFGDLAVLFRLNAMADALEEAFHRAGIPVARSGERPLVQRFPANLLWRFFQALRAPENPYFRDRYHEEARSQGIREILDFAPFQGAVPTLEVLERAVRAHGLEPESLEARQALDRLRELARAGDGNISSFLDALSLDRGIDHEALPGDRVALMSLHAAKGLEWPVVFITGCEAGLLPLSLYGESLEEEERRLLYVGITRARLQVVLSFAARRNLNGRVLQNPPSPFLSQIPRHLVESLGRRGSGHQGRAHKQLSLF